MRSLSHWRLLVVRVVKEFSDDNCSQMAAAISYYVLFSLFPLLIFSVGVLGIFLNDSQLQDDLVDVVLDYVPLSEDKGRNDVADAVRGVAGVGSGALGLLGLVGMAWSGSNMFGVIRKSLNTAYDLDIHRPIVRQKALDLAMVLAFAPFFIGSLAATTALRILRRETGDLPFVSDASNSIGLLWEAVFFLIPVTVSFCAFVFLYWIVPATTVKLRHVWPGAVIAALLFETTKVGFSVYLENFSNYDVVFGSLGAVVAFLFWIFIGANILLLGAEIASEYPRVMRGDYDRPPEVDRPRLPRRQRLALLLRSLVLHDHERKPGDR